jgi:DNA-directed RNA polymerase II subunit RPB1
MGVVKDTLCSIRKFTLHNAFLNWDPVQNILIWVPDWDSIVPIPVIVNPKPLWTGKQILSMCIPRRINIFCSADPKSSNPIFGGGMMIENGEILFGIVKKKTVSATRGGLIDLSSAKRVHLRPESSKLLALTSWL